MIEGYTFSVDAMIRRHHVYKDIWIPIEGEVLPCSREVGNYQHPMAVAVKKGLDIVGHVPRKISAVCSIFLRKGGSIICRVTGHRHYSIDLVQGGLEVPCILIFISPHDQAVYGEKAQKLVRSALAVKTTVKATSDCQFPHVVAVPSSDSDTCSNSSAALKLTAHKTQAYVMMGQQLLKQPSLINLQPRNHD